ncbi:hypothetical protein CEXT_593371 [Caerostris extrusa]|uniref:Uncharacterized protein n=1 Tax=Caerostris extrusa TaxID=172846 RepID=A0AAV4TUK5_CAEEX|nr:hypothetical protein CEXT_593371 [Caerostris extrusa]
MRLRCRLKKKKGAIRKQNLNLNCQAKDFAERTSQTRTRKYTHIIAHSVSSCLLQVQENNYGRANARLLDEDRQVGNKRASSGPNAAHFQPIAEECPKTFRHFSGRIARAKTERGVVEKEHFLLFEHPRNIFA